MRVKCLAQEHNKTTSVRVRTWPARLHAKPCGHNNSHKIHAIYKQMYSIKVVSSQKESGTLWSFGVHLKR